MRNGLFIVIEGPNGSGKSSICTALQARLSASGHDVICVSEPSNSAIGVLIKAYREIKEHALTLACLLAADRYANLIDKIRPNKKKGCLVICDRYLASTFVYQRLHGLPDEFLLNLHSFIDTPDLTVILEVELEVLRSRLTERGSNTFSENLTSLEHEVDLYETVYNDLVKLGHHVIRMPNPVGQIELVLDDIMKEIEGMHLLHK